VPPWTAARLFSHFMQDSFCTTCKVYDVLRLNTFNQDFISRKMWWSKIKPMRLRVLDSIVTTDPPRFCGTLTL
jgi:hypothetical protein